MERRAIQESGADQEVPHPDVLPDQITNEFDFNEFFNLEKTMPGLASVRLGEHCMLLGIVGQTGDLFINFF